MRASPASAFAHLHVRDLISQVFQRAGCLCRDPLAAPGKSQAFLGGCLDGHPVDADPQGIRHILAHLREMNHGPRFWAVVASVLPDWRARRALGRNA